VKRRAVFAALAALTVACGDSSTEPEVPTVTGQWSGPILENSTMTLTLSEAAGGSVGGSGTFWTPGVGGIPLTVSGGTHAYPSLTLIVAATGFENVNLTGTVNAGAIDARLNGSGFWNVRVRLAKQ
jgi:hypothetical protein